MNRYTKTYTTCKHTTKAQFAQNRCLITKSLFSNFLNQNIICTRFATDGDASKSTNDKNQSPQAYVSIQNQEVQFSNVKHGFDKITQSKKDIIQNIENIKTI